MIRERRFITCSVNATNVVYNIKNTIKHSILREPSFVDEFYAEKGKPSDDKLESYSYVDPVYMLFNQQRLERLGKLGVEKFLEQFKDRHDPFANLRKQCSDQDLAALIKSKHLQSMSEMNAWIKYMESNIDTFKSEVQKVIEANKQPLEQKQDVQLKTE